MLELVIDKLRTGRVKYLYDKPAIRENGWFFLFAAAEPLPAEKRAAVIQPNKGRRATPEARPAEKERWL